eukprot:6819140-Prymnesium_polylepis.1
MLSASRGLKIKFPTEGARPLIGLLGVVGVHKGAGGYTYTCLVDPCASPVFLRRRAVAAYGRRSRAEGW